MSAHANGDAYEQAEEAQLQVLRDERLRLEGRIEGVQEALGHYRNLKRQGMLPKEETPNEAR